MKSREGPKGIRRAGAPEGSRGRISLGQGSCPSSETGSRKGGKEEDKFAGGEGQSTGS